MSFNNVSNSRPVDFNGENSPSRDNSPPEKETGNLPMKRTSERIYDTAEPVKVSAVQLSAIFKALGKK